jgi:NitT/TauT family transport system substrate-binding protein
MKPRYYIASWLIAHILILSSACGSGDKNGGADKTVRIAYIPIAHSVPVMAMHERTRHHDSDYAIEPVRFTSWPEVVDALRTGRVDGASMLFEVALRAQETDGDLTLISLAHRGGNVVVAKNDIGSYRDLIGKTVAIPHKLSPQNTLLRIVMERERLSSDDIHVIEISPAEMPFTMASGTISAYVVAEPYGSVAESTGAGYILETSDTILPDAICCVLAFRNEALLSQEGMGGWLLDQLAAAASDICSNPGGAAELFGRFSNFNETVIRNAIGRTSYENLSLAKEEYIRYAETALRYGVLSGIPPFDGFVYQPGAEITE